MRKLIAAINMTLDGFCDHTALIADEEIHQHYNELLRSAVSLPLIKNVRDRINLKLLKTKTFSSGVVTLYYEPTNKVSA